jgi:hypothetical protein
VGNAVGRRYIALIGVALAVVVSLAVGNPAAAQSNQKVPIPPFGAYTGIAPNPASPLTRIAEIEASLERSFDTQRIYSTKATPDLTSPGSATQDALAHGRTPWISITPKKWDAVASGNHDNDIEKLANDIKTLQAPVFLTINYEPEDEVVSHYSIQNYIDAWRRYHDRFAAMGVTNVSWGYIVKAASLETGNPLYANATSMYPGDGYVDWVGVDTYNMPYDVQSGYDACKSKGKNEPKVKDVPTLITNRSKYPCQVEQYATNGLDANWRNLSSRIESAYHWVTNVKPGEHTLPMAVTEWGSTYDWRQPTHRAEWIGAVHNDLKLMPQIKLIAYANTPEWELGWPRPENPGTSLQAFKALANDPYFTQSVPPPDTASPTVALVQPTAGEYSGVIMAEATATDNVAVDHVSFIANDTWLATDYTAPYTYERDTTANEGGQYAVRAAAFDAAGNAAYSEPAAVTVNNKTTGPPTIATLTAEPSEVTEGGSTTLTWSTTDAAGCSVSPDGPQGTLHTSWQTPPLFTVGTIIYKLTCSNQAGEASKETTVTVKAAERPPSKPIFVASKTQVMPGENVLLSWSSDNAQRCSLNPGNIMANGGIGSQLVENLRETTTFSLICNNEAGETSADPVTVTVTNNPAVLPPQIVLFTFNPSSTAHGGVSTLSSRVTNVAPSGCNIVGTPYTAVSGNFDAIVPPQEFSRTLTEICTNIVGETTTAIASLTVGGAPPPPANVPPEQAIPGSTAATSETQTALTDETTHTVVTNARAKATVVRGTKITLTPALMNAQFAKLVEKVEYYNDSELIQTVTKPPFALDTAPLRPGTYTITERIYTLDGFVIKRTTQVTVLGPRVVWLAPVMILLLTGGCILLAWYFSRRKRGAAHPPA